ncbi:MAG TPA: PAS domain-containing protein [Stellaceae bacterium]|nr:PAS domain-containing protein [Stellaceae bacterium]
MNPADAEYESGIVDPQIRRFVEYLRSKRGEGRYPARAALDPLDFRYVLGDVVIIEAYRSPADSRRPWHFRYRLVCANVVERDGYNLTNQTLEDLPEPEYRERVRKTWLEVCETGMPAHGVRELVLDQRLRFYEVVVLPLASNGEDIDMLISVQRETKPATVA